MTREDKKYIEGELQAAKELFEDLENRVLKIEKELPDVREQQQDRVEPEVMQLVFKQVRFEPYEYPEIATISAIRQLFDSQPELSGKTKASILKFLLDEVA